jgi:hypothetical protein
VPRVNRRDADASRAVAPSLLARCAGARAPERSVAQHRAQSAGAALSALLPAGAAAAAQQAAAEASAAHAASAATVLDASFALFCALWASSASLTGAARGLRLRSARAA